MGANHMWNATVAIIVGVALLGDPLLILCADPVAGVKAESDNDIPSNDIQRVVSHLTPLWQAANSGVTSCDIRYYEYRPTLRQGMTMEDVTQTIDEYGLKTSSDRIMDFAQAISTQPINTNYRPTRFAWDGVRSRSDLSRMSIVEDEEYRIWDDIANGNIQVYLRGACPINFRRLSSFRVVPIVPRSKPEVTGHTAHSVELTSYPKLGTRNMKSVDNYDWATGLPLHARRYLEGQLISDHYQLGLVEFEGGGYFPTCHIEIQYDTTRLGSSITRFVITRLVEARFQLSFPPDEFVVKKPHKVELWDGRTDPKNSKCLFVAEQEADDARTLLPNAMETIREQPHQAMTWPMRLFLIANGLALIGFGVWMWRRSSVKPPKS